jgi:phosphoglycolate phosphatase-like HAD superfamily hydrolase
MKKIKIIIFDFDGVLVESVEIKNLAFSQLFLNKSSDLVTKISDFCIINPGVTRRKKFSHILGEILQEDPTEEKLHDLDVRFSKLTNEQIIGGSEVDGATTFLKNNKDYKLFIASASPQKDLEYIVEKKGWGPYFNKIYGTPLTKCEIITDILKRESSNGSDVVLVGDTIHDQSAAFESSVLFIARVRESYIQWKDPPQLMVDDLQSLEEILGSIN